MPPAARLSQPIPRSKLPKKLNAGSIDAIVESAPIATVASPARTTLWVPTLTQPGRNKRWVSQAAAITTALGAYGYTRLSNAGAALVIGSMLILSVPLRRLLRRRDVRIGDTGLGLGAAGYGVVVGGTSGPGVILLSLLMAAGLEGAAVIATDAIISVVTSLIKISVFGLAGVVTTQVLAFALLIGAIALPGTFLAKAFVERMPVHIHTAILDVAVIAGGMVMISSAVRTLFG